MCGSNPPDVCDSCVADTHKWYAERIETLEKALDVAQRALHDINCAPDGYDATQRSYEAITAIQAALGAETQP